MSDEHLFNLITASAYISILMFMVFTMLYPISRHFVYYGLSPAMDNILVSWGYILWAGLFLAVFVKEMYY